jgi:hypothetical protein
MIISLKGKKGYSRNTGVTFSGAFIRLTWHGTGVANTSVGTVM